MKRKKKVKAVLGCSLVIPQGNGYHKDKRTKREQNKLNQELKDWKNGKYES